MLFTADIGNTEIAVVVYNNSETALSFRINTHPALSVNKYRSIISENLKNTGEENITGAIISSVCPSVTENFSEACVELFNTKPVLVNAQTVLPKLGLKIKIAEPETLGADLICGITAAAKLFPAPCIIIDMGTVTKFLAVNKDGEFIGGGLFPGLRLCIETFFHGELIADSARTLNFANTNEKEYANAIQNTTENCMRAGILYGMAEMIDGIVARYESELGGKCSVISTGGHFNSIRTYCRTKTEFIPDLLSRGLKIIYEQLEYK